MEFHKIDEFIFRNEKKYRTDVAFRVVCDQLVAERHAVADLLDDISREGFDVDRLIEKRQAAFIDRILPSLGLRRLAPEKISEYTGRRK